MPHAYYTRRNRDGISTRKAEDEESDCDENVVAESASYHIRIPIAVNGTDAIAMGESASYHVGRKMTRVIATQA